MADNTRIFFREGESIVVSDSVETVAQVLSGKKEFARMSTEEGTVVYVNPANVLYLQQLSDPAARSLD